jgi:hypothetical protein
MSILKLNSDFNRLSDSVLEVKTNSIITSMTGRPEFPTPTPDMATMQTKLTVFSGALAVAKTGNSYEKAFKNQKRAELIALLQSLAVYVLFTANNDPLVAKLSGFNIAKNPSPAPEVTPAANQQLADGANAGELKYSFDRVPGAKSYVYQWTPDPITPESVWTSIVGTVSKMTFTGLESGKKCWCRVVSIGTNGQGVYSEPVSRIVQ